MTYKLTLVTKQGNKKMGPFVATTYRAGSLDNYGTCPKTCELLPNKHLNFATNTLDRDYLDVIQNTIPRSGIAWTYSHFDFSSFEKQTNDKCVINFSADTLKNAKKGLNAGFPTVLHIPEKDRSSFFKKKNFVLCPEQLAKNKNFTCSDCGDGRPLCARADRDYVIVFIEHGIKKDKCYAGQFRSNIAWTNTRKKPEKEINLKDLKSWIKNLPRQMMLRHHVAGDLGADNNKYIPIKPV